MITIGFSLTTSNVTESAGSVNRRSARVATEDNDGK